MSDTQATASTQSSEGAQPGVVATEGVSPAAGSPPAGNLLTEGTAPASQQVTDGQTAGETKPADSTKGDQEAKTDDKPADAPEKYEFKAPDGKHFDEGVITAYSEVAKELGLPQDAAQKILDVLAPKVAERYAARQLEAIDKAATDWRDATVADKEIGGDKLNENLAVAKKALDAFGTPELRKLLGPYDAEKNPTGTGLGNHPELVRAFFKAGKAISEDRFVPGGKAPAAQDRNPAKALYPNQPA